MSLNTHGLRGYERCKQLISKYLYASTVSPNPDVICFQETHITQELELELLRDTNFDLCFVNSTERSGGLIIGFRRNLNYVLKAQQSFAFLTSAVLVAHCNIYGKPYIVCNCYFNPRDNFNALVSEFSNIVSKFGNNNVIICGDFNTSLEIAPNEDQEFHFKKQSQLFASFVECINAVDVWRIFNPDKKQFTHRPSFGASRRLDYILTNEGLLNQIENSSIGIAHKTDHCPVYLYLDSSRNPPGKGYWKFPSFLIKNSDFKQFLKKEIPILHS